MSTSNSAPNSVLVMGANGSFGSHAALAFAAAGWTVLAQTREGKQLLPRLAAQPNITHTPISINDTAAMAGAAKKCAAIINALNPPYKNWHSAIPIITNSVLTAAKSSRATILLPGNVYNYGADMPPLLTRQTPYVPTTKLGKIREAMENSYREAAMDGGRDGDGDGVQTIILRIGDFLSANPEGNWFDTQMTQKLDKGKFAYPGKTDIPHAWGYLPDAARAIVGLAEIRDQLPKFSDIPFAGTTMSGEEMHKEIEAAMGRGNLDREIKMGTMPWGMMKFLSLFIADLKGVFEMRYLWDTPHALDETELNRLLPDFQSTPNAEVIRACVARYG